MEWAGKSPSLRGSDAPKRLQKCSWNRLSQKKKKKKHELLVILLAGASNNRFFFLFYEFFFFDHLGKRCSPLVNVENMETDIKK